MKLGPIAKQNVFIALVALVAACGGDGAAPNTQGSAELQKGASCNYAGGTFEDGRTFSSPDGCNSCRCDNGVVACTKRGCAPLPPPLPADDGGPGEPPADAGVVTDADTSIDAAVVDSAAPPPFDAGGGCVYGGVTYAQGASFPSLDKCNSCFCGSGGRVACTKKLCKGDAGEP